MKPELAGWLVGLSESRLAVILMCITVTLAAVLISLRCARRSRASVRHLLLVSAFAVLGVLPVASLLVPSIRIAVPVASLPDPMSSLASTPTVPATDQIAPIVDEPGNIAPAPRRIAMSSTTAVAAVWAIGAAICLAPILFGLVKMRSLRRSATLWAVAGTDVFLHASIRGPVTFGVIRPVIVLPDDARAWSHGDLMRALIHEREHVRRWDWLSQCLSRVVCAVYWFHPLVWVARRRLDLEAERACDDAVLRHESRPDDVTDATAYADQLVVLARRLSSARPPLLAMANRADLAARVGALLDARQRRGRAGLLAVVFSTSAAASLVAMMSSFKLVAAPQSIANAQAPRFEVASIKLCAPGETGAVAGGRSGGGAMTTSPGRVNIQCTTVLDLINRAYVRYGDPPPLNHPNVPGNNVIQGGPPWAQSDRYTIEAKAEDTAATSLLMGAMLRRLLEDRFQLKLHEDVKDVPAFALTVASGGLKVKPVDPSICTQSDPNNNGPRVMRPSPTGAPLIYDPNAPADSKPLCVGGIGAKPPYVTYDVTGQRFDQIVRTLSSMLFERPVVDRTGVAGQFSFHVEFAPDDRIRPTPLLQRDPSAIPPGPFLFDVFEKDLGLKFVPTRVPQSSLVIDRLERPSDPPASNARVARDFGGASPNSQKFDVVSIKRCDAQNPPVPPIGGGARQGGSGPIQTSPDRLSVNCATVDRLVAIAYVLNGDPLLNNQPASSVEKQSQWIRNIPDWARTETYAIEAKASQAVDKAVLLGPMLRSLLEDRFRLTLHRDLEDAPMYALVVAKGGLKMNPIGPDGCTKNDAGFGSQEAAAENARAVAAGEIAPRCGTMTTFTGTMPGSRRWIIGGETMPKLAQTLSNTMDRHVVDKTNVPDMFNVRLEFAENDQVSTSPTMFKALEDQLGLKLEPTKDQRGFLVVDRIERPKPDGPLALTRQP